ncbi:GFA family protein [Roseibium sp. SCP14]|uniref:GFA family protein n=1 Tax=Roseibium sp. SCP14 TaxID=3141375 RepID=UPI0033387596
MTEKLDLSGKCMCGAVRFTAVARKPSVVACHCDMCRRWSAGPFMSLNCEGVSFDREDSVSRIKSSDWAERGFCNKCGSSLFYRISGSSDYQMSAGLFDDQSMMALSLQLFTDFKPDFYDFSNETRKMTAEEVIAMFAATPK